MDYDDGSKAAPDRILSDADKGSPAKTAEGIRQVFYRIGSMTAKSWLCLVRTR